MAKFSGFCGQAYKMDSLPISAQRCINWFPEVINDKNANSEYVLQPTPGYKELIEIVDNSLPAGSYTRQMYRTSKGIGTLPNPNGSIIIVIGPNIYWLKDDNTYEKLGAISNIVTRVSITDDGFGIIIADGTNIYRIDLATKAFTYVDVDIEQPTYVGFLGGYTIAIGSNENIPQNTFFWSKLYENDNWDPLDYASAEISQDPITGMEIVNGYLYLYGPNSYELWSPTGDSALPFARSYASVGAIGLHAPTSISKIGSNVFMLGTTNQGSAAVYMSNGTDMVKVSTTALEEEWSHYNVTDCTSWTISNAGNNFVLFNFDILDKTYVLNVDQLDWHERATREELTDTLHRFQLQYGIQRSAQILVGDRNSSKIYLLSNSYTTENGNNILRIRTTSHQNAEQKPVLFNAVRFDMDTGNGITNEDKKINGSNRYTQAPTIMFRYSHDRARTWSNELRQTFGATGQYNKTVEFSKLGVSRNLTVEFKISDPCATAILNGWIYPVVSQRSRQ